MYTRKSAAGTTRIHSKLLIDSTVLAGCGNQINGHFELPSYTNS